MGYMRYPMQPHLRRRTFNGVHGAQQAMDLLRTGIRLQRKQAMRDHLQMLFRFRNKKFQHLGRNLTIVRGRGSTQFRNWRGRFEKLNFFRRPCTWASSKSSAVADLPAAASRG